MSRTLFVAHEDVVNLRLFAERVIGRQNCSARITEDMLHAFPLQAFPDNLSTSFLHKLQDLLTSCPFVPSIVLVFELH